MRISGVFFLSQTLDYSLFLPLPTTSVCSREKGKREKFACRTSETKDHGKTKKSEESMCARRLGLKKKKKKTGV